MDHKYLEYVRLSIRIFELRKAFRIMMSMNKVGRAELEMMTMIIMIQKAKKKGLKDYLIKA